jgi:LuxR family transcriptional regulator of csgAB operon
MDKASQQKKALYCATSRSLVIVGHPGVQNSLLTGLLERNLGARCAVMSVEAVRSNQITDGATALLDAAAVPVGSFDAALHTLCNKASVNAVALFNAEPNVSVEGLLQWPKMRGLFHSDTSEEHLIKGVRAILNNEIWLPRKLLSDYLEMTRGPHRIQMTEVVDLTRKERETLRVMVEGASNVDIANTLNVSPHTVKTHVYNLFRKIKVNNRVQAVSWALANLEKERRDIQ